MSRKKKHNKKEATKPPTLPTITVPIKNPKITLSVLSALEADDIQALEASFKQGNPFAFVHDLPDGNSGFIQTTAALYRAWNCLLWLHRMIYFKNLHFKQIKGGLLEKTEEDFTLAFEFANYMVFMESDPEASKFIKDSIYWLFKSASQSDRTIMVEKYPGREYYMEAYLLIQSEEDNVILDDPNVVRVPDIPTNPKPVKRLRRDGL